MISFLPLAIPLKSELAYEIFDKGQVRFWLQAEHLSPDSSYRFIINDREVSDSEVSACECGLWLWRHRVQMVRSVPESRHSGFAFIPFGLQKADKVGERRLRLALFRALVWVT